MKQRIMGKMPEFEGKYYIHSTACVIGDVHCKKNVNVWPNAVIRGDLNRIEIGEWTNIQDNAVLHVLDDLSLQIGNYVTIGHQAILHACEVGDGSIIGMGAIILDGARIGKNCIIGAGAVIPPYKQIPDGSVVVGNPFKVTRQVTAEDIENNLLHTKIYWELALEYIKSADIY